jgi:uncharacterized protein
MADERAGPAATPPSGGAAEPSMEDILASIRRILSDDVVPPAPGALAEPAPGDVPEVGADPAEEPLDLTEDMLVAAAAPSPADPPAGARPAPPPAPPPTPPGVSRPAQVAAAPKPAPRLPDPATPESAPATERPAPAPSAERPAPAAAAQRPGAQGPGSVPSALAAGASDPSLLAPAAAAAAAASVGALLRAVASDRSSPVSRGGPSIEDVVREEIRPLLKDWLDRHLPPMVERLVRAEIERVVGQALS